MVSSGDPSPATSPQTAASRHVALGRARVLKVLEKGGYFPPISSYSHKIEIKA